MANILVHARKQASILLQNNVLSYCYFLYSSWGTNTRADKVMSYFFVENKGKPIFYISKIPNILKIAQFKFFPKCVALKF